MCSGECPDPGLLQGPPGDGEVPAGGRGRPGAQDRRDAYCPNGSLNGRPCRGCATAFGLRRAGQHARR